MSARPFFRWGVNGHPVRAAEAYAPSGNGLATQIGFIDSLGFDTYRVDLPVESDWTLALTLDSVAQAAVGSGVEILPVLTFGPPVQVNRDSAYKLGRKVGDQFGRRYGARFPYVEVGNELDSYAIGDLARLGIDSSDYDTTRVNIVAELIRGMVDGLKAEAPSVKTIVDLTWAHTGFVPLLRARGVTYDYQGYHMYDHVKYDDVLTTLAAFGKPIWITEASRTRGSRGSGGEGAQEAALRQQLRDAYANQQVQAFIVYELYDEPAFLSNGNPNDDDEAFYGLISKPAFHALRLGKEEQVFGPEDFVYALYLHLNGRAPDRSGLSYWTGRFRDWQNKGALLDRFLPEESNGVFVGDMFRQLLDRSADPSTRSYWSDRMRDGLSREGVIAELCAGTEFWSLSGGTIPGFVDRLYLKLFRRAGDRAVRGRWITQLSNGMSRLEAAGRLLATPEYQRLFLEDQYRALLGRQADAGGLTYYGNAMQAGKTQQDVIRDVVSSPEFWTKAVEAGYRRR